MSAEPLLPSIPAERVLSDSPLPSPAAILIGLTLEAPDTELAEKARQALELGLPPSAGGPFVFASQAILYLKYPLVP